MAEAKLAEARSSTNADEIEQWFKQHLAMLIDMPADEIDEDWDFESFGIDSIQAVDLVTALETWLGLGEDAQLDFIFDAPTIRIAAEDVAAAVNGGERVPSAA